MKKILLTIVFLLTTVLPAFSQVKEGKETPVCPLGNEWIFSPEFSDEFNGKLLDADKWWDFNPTWIGRVPCLFSRDNVKVADGFLQLTTRKMPADWETLENKTRGYHTWTSAIVKSKKRVMYGYFEVRSKAMASAASSAFWFYDPLDAPVKHKEGDVSEEIDVFEVFGKHPKLGRTYFTTVHVQRTPYVESVVRLGLKSTGSKWKSPFDFSADYHLYALLWTPDVLKWYVDGQEVWSQKNEDYHRPLYIMFDSEIFVNWGGIPDDKDLPSTFNVDYLRRWTKKEQAK